MLTREQLLDLHRSLRNEQVLSVYIDGTAKDPATYRLWRLQLHQALNDVRVWLEDSSHAERMDFENRVRMLDVLLERIPANIGAPGWAGFVTASGIRRADLLPVPVPTLAVWSTGASLAPYIRALKQSRPAIIAVIAATKTTLWRYRFGHLDEIETVRAHHVVEPPSHMGRPPRQGFHSPTRGSTGHDSAERGLLAGRDRMLADAAERITLLAADDAWVLLGGTKRLTARLAERIIGIPRDRVVELDALDVHASQAQIIDAVLQGVSTARNTLDQKRLNEIVEDAGAHELGVVGPADTQRALELACVHELYFTHRYLEDHGALAEETVRHALDQNAEVEEVSGTAADYLNQLGGMAASLRFRPSGIEDPETMEMSA